MSRSIPCGAGRGRWVGPDHAHQCVHTAPAGQVNINGGRFNPAAPFGGFKQSTTGRELGVFGLEELTAPESLQF